MLVINLSPLEIVEDNCNTTHTFNITVKDLKHAKSLLHRYYVNDNDEVKEILESDINNIVGTKIRLRSPITCFTSNFKLCKTCVGNYNFTSPYIGIITGQYLEERLTQSSMSSHHLSGAATLNIDPMLKEYFANELIDIVNNENDFELTFKTQIPLYVINKLNENTNYRLMEVTESNTKLRFMNYRHDEFIENQDAGQIVANVSDLLKSFITNRKNTLPSIEDTYYGLIEEFFKISSVYTIFIETLLANSHVNKDDIIYRYCLKDGLDSKLFRRYSIKSLNKIISKILSWLYEPNKSSIRTFYDYSNDNKNELDINSLSVFEKIWIDKF
jgi:hypothetical protein